MKKIERFFKDLLKIIEFIYIHPLTMHECGLIMDLVKTCEAEIKAGMISKRVREGESRAETQPVKWTAEGTVKGIILPSIL